MEDKNEIISLVQKKQLIEQELNNLNYGAVEIRENKYNKYIYVHYREDGISLTKYVGEYSDELYNLIYRELNKNEALNQTTKKTNKRY